MNKIKNLFLKIKNIFLAHKIIWTILLLVLGVGVFFFFKNYSGNDADTKYFFSKVKKDSIAVTVTGTGQISAYTQFDIKPKVSGDVVYVGVANGQNVKTGSLILQLDTTSAEKNLRDLEINLENARIALEKLKGPDSLEKPRNKEDAEQDLVKTYDDGFNEVSNAFLKLPTIMSGLQAILIGSDKTLGGGGQSNLDYFAGSVLLYDENATKYKDDALLKYQKARKDYDQNFLDYKATSRFDSVNKIEVLIDQTYNTTKTVAEAVKSASNLLQFHSDKLVEHNLKPQSLVDTYLFNLSGYTGDSNSLLLSLLGIKNSIKSAKDAILNSDLDLRTQELSLKQKENSYLDAKEDLADYYVRAPFSGVITNLDTKKFDSVSSGSAVATLITDKKIATISLNEVDISKVKVGQEVDLTFDAIADLVVKGEVSEVDSIGTVSQGVVSYDVSISFESEDSQIKPGMSVSASIVTDKKLDVLVLPSGAIKTRQNGDSYVETFDGIDEKSSIRSGYTSSDKPVQTVVEVGLTNDTQAEILGGLVEGQMVISRTVSGSSSNSSSNTTSSSRTGGGQSILGGTFRMR